MEPARKKVMPAAERKRKSRANKKANMDDELAAFQMKEREHIASAVRAHREQEMRHMTNHEITEFKKTESNRISVLQKGKRDDIKKNRVEVEAIKRITTPIRENNPYKTRQSFGKALSAARLNLPGSPRRIKAIVTGLASEVGLKVDTKYYRSLEQNCSQQLRERVKEFYYHSDITYTAPGMVDKMVVYEATGKKRLRKYYLTLHLKEAYALYQEVCSPELKCCRSLFCALRPKNVLLMCVFPQDQCKCQVLENFDMKLEAMGVNYDNIFWDSMLCNAAVNSNCWMNECAECQDGKKLVPIKSLGSLTTYKQWGDVVIPHNSKTNDDGGRDSYKKLSMIIKEVCVEEVLDEFQQ